MEDMVQMAVIGTGDGGLKPGEIVTPMSQPNVIISVVTPIAALLIRTANTYLTMMVGLVTAGMTTDVIPYDDFHGLVVLSAKLAVSGTAIGFAKDCITIFSRLETKFPLLTGNV